ncbi:DUF2924 domain-containing protein [Candidatus Avelusimicrobium alvi]|uniref:DUF2924 domain-containing protein n=1 Tax=Candidatus Avelusimicrobium alvi TaxID=3416221 RepID=UPI003D0F7C29
MKKQTNKTRKITLKNLPDIPAAMAVDIQAKSSSSTPKRDPRIPPAGTVLTKTYHGQTLEAKVLENGFEYQGKVYKSISRVAMEIVRHPISGYVFFGLSK